MISSRSLDDFDHRFRCKSNRKIDPGRIGSSCMKCEESERSFRGLLQMMELVLLSSIILLLMYNPSNLLSALRVLLCSQSFLPAAAFQSMHRWLNTNSLTGQRRVKPIGWCRWRGSTTVFSVVAKAIIVHFSYVLS